MNLSYWEQKEWFSDINYCIIGSGIVGLNCALQLRKNYPKAKIVILEKGFLPTGASTKNAGFACFGSVSELLYDLQNHTENEVLDLVEKRWKGLKLLRKTVADTKLDYQKNNGFELFYNQTDFEKNATQLSYINKLLKPIFKKDVFKLSPNNFGFQNIHHQLIENVFEAQLNPAKMIQALLQKAIQKNVFIINGIEVLQFDDLQGKTVIKTNKSDIYAKKICITTNGFAAQLLNENVKPARAQVLITKPIKNLKIKGTFHIEEGYYYFRNFEDRILFGGGRNLDFKTEETTAFGQTQLIQNQLEKMLKEIILPNTIFEIDHRWSGIMGVGNQKKPIVKQLSTNVFCAVRLGGMGVALGSLVGKELADLV